MLYITIKEKDIDEANNYIRENIDHTAGDSFVVNKEDDSGKGFCVISLPDDDKDYANKIVDFLTSKKKTKDATVEKDRKNVDKLKDKASAGPAGKVK